MLRPCELPNKKPSSRLFQIHILVGIQSRSIRAGLLSNENLQPLLVFVISRLCVQFISFYWITKGEFFIFLKETSKSHVDSLPLTSLKYN